MATITSIKIYGNGTVTTSDYIGMKGGTQFERVYGIRTGATGATQLQLLLTYTSDGGFHTPSSYGKVTSSESCIANKLNPQLSGATAGQNDTTAGTMTYTLSGSFLPNTVYYIHLWSEGSSGDYRWLSVRQEISGDMCRTAVSESGAYGGSAIKSVTASVDTTNNVTVAVNRNSTAFWHKAVFSIGGTTKATTAAFETSVSYTCPRSWFSGYGTVTSLTVTVTVTTYTTSACTTAIGTASSTFTLKADSGMKPVLQSGAATCAVYNTGAVSGFTQYIQGYSKIRATFIKNKVSMTNAVGASIAAYSVSYEGNTVTSASVSGSSTNVDSATVNASGTVTLTVTDTRGRKASVTESITVAAYSKPTVKVLRCERCDSGGTADAEGQHAALKATAGYADNITGNSVTLKAAVGTTEYTLTSGTQRVITGLTPDASVTVVFTATDALGNSKSYSVKIPTQVWAMQFRGGGNGVAFGKAAERDKELEVPADWKLDFGGVSKIGAMVDVKDRITFSDVNPASLNYTTFHSDGNIMVINYSSTSKAHGTGATDGLLFTIPAGLRPKTNYEIPFTFATDVVSGRGYISGSSGKAYIYRISSTDVAGIIILNLTYVI